MIQRSSLYIVRMHGYSNNIIHICLGQLFRSDYNGYTGMHGPGKTVKMCEANAEGRKAGR